MNYRSRDLLDDLRWQKMTTKVVYFTVGGKPEQAEFSSDFPADEIKGRNQFVCLHEHFDCPSLLNCYRELCISSFILF